MRFPFRKKTNTLLSLDDLLTNLCLPVYQNEDFIRGLYEVIRDGSVDEILAESEHGRAHDVSAKGRASFGLGGGRLHLLPKTELGLDGGVNMNGHQSQKLSQKTTFSNSYKLAYVLKYLKLEESVKNINSMNDLEKICLGNFVEYTAFFAKNEISELLELLHNDLINAIGNTQLVKDCLTIFINGILEKKLNPTNMFRIDDDGSYEIIEVIKQTILSLKRDFKSDYTTDFYGNIIDRSSNKIGIKSIVICDDQFFSNGDSQKILDGNFKVFGKVVKIQKSSMDDASALSMQNIYESISQFDRNKLLKRIEPEALVRFDKYLKDTLTKMNMSNDFDLIIKESAIKVIPIAIYI